MTTATPHSRFRFAYGVAVGVAYGFAGGTGAGVSSCLVAVSPPGVADGG